MKEIYFTVFESPIGLFYLFSSKDGLCGLQIFSFVSLGSPPEKEKWGEKKWGKKQWKEQLHEQFGIWFFDRFTKEGKAIPKENRTDPILQKACKELDLYFQGNLKSFTTQLDIEGTEFQKKVWRALIEIPYGEHVSYQDIAIEVDSPKAVRAVGQANHRNLLSIFIPCHRVLYKDGSLGGYGSGLGVKEWLLNHEKRFSKT